MTISGVFVIVITHTESMLLLGGPWTFNYTYCSFFTHGNCVKLPADSER